jgi:uncharacterized protein involved in exopolysaccharide biosynthesis
MQDEIQLRDLVRALWRLKWWVILTTLLVMSATAAVSFVSPKVYRATALLVPPEVDQEWPTADGMKTRFGAAALGAAIRPSTTASDIIIGILKSRRAAMAVIEKFELRRAYPNEPSLFKLPKMPWQEAGDDGSLLSDIIKELQARTEVRTTKEGLLSISVEDSSPKRAAEMVQCYLDELSRVNTELRTTYDQYLARVLDPPIPPDKKYKPRVMINTLVSGVAAGFLWLVITCSRLSLAATVEPRAPVDLNGRKQAAPAGEMVSD